MSKPTISLASRSLELALRLRKVKRKTKEQHEFLKLFERFNPVIESDCVMNRLCKYIESVDFGIRSIVNKYSPSTSISTP